MFAIEFSHKAEKQLKKLPLIDQQRILRKLDDSALDPTSTASKLIGLDLWRLRVGSYRLTIDIIIKKQHIYIVRVDRRDKVYDNL